ncbi:PDR/VanB family oxidoreductase [Alteromonas lipolytica]|uniref:Vanillate O-demethylase oxidoreductase n=1 Tax=Alteromonas lipolytica TaxID=1856405 RepID=A0A1E8FAQ3_9ALTE|nr:PDR/VanB family oxidoreductase [Alteromonas lipolytica]OFI33012.1 Vanillate O-demethylase oxidoreductase [Alteromonas lipolytica]GGF63339.1 vanillate O-demethylase oxidoreductase [Alteromonas lipolytica]
MSSELIDVVVSERTNQGNGIAVLTLKRADGTVLPAFTAGAHIDIHLADELIRQYSLCGSPDSTESYRIGVLNDPASRGGSVYVFEQLNVGSQVQISAPRNHFPLADNATKHLLIGGGIGITPMIAMAKTLAQQGADFALHYCLRSQSAGAFVAELQAEFGERLTLHCDDLGDAQKLNPGELFTAPESGQHVYVCGPGGFMDWVIDSAKAAGYSSDHVHFEYFNAEVDITGDSFEVYCAQSDITVEVGSDQSIAKALKGAGIKIDVSCEEGVCGTCITDVLEGEPDHRDHFLTDEEKEDNDQIAVCCSRACSKRLVLDI